MKSLAGFTIVELLLSLVISAILLSLALPSYQQYTLRSHRSEGLDALLNTAIQLERSRLINRRYTALETQSSASNKYQIEISVNDDGSEYLLSAIPQQGQSKDSCGTLTLDHLSQQGSAGDTAKCWQGR